MHADTPTSGASAVEQSDMADRLDCVRCTGRSAGGGPSPGACASAAPAPMLARSPGSPSTESAGLSTLMSGDMGCEKPPEPPRPA